MLVSSVALGVGVGLLRGGKLGRLASLQVRYWWVVVGAFLLKFALVRFSSGTFVQAYGPYLHILVYLALVLVVLLNLGLPRMKLFLGGVLMNATAVLLNGGRMPVYGDTLVALGKAEDIEAISAGVDITHIIVAPSTAVPFLGDWVPVPLPFPTAASPGDVVLALGLIGLINGVMCSKT